LSYYHSAHFAYPLCAAYCAACAATCAREAGYATEDPYLGAVMAAARADIVASAAQAAAVALEGSA
jgi:hypothetical protein